MNFSRKAGELLFFIVYFYVFRFLTDLEYNFWERKITGIAAKEIEYSILYGTVNVIAYSFFYKIVRQYLKTKRLLQFLLLIVLFLFCYSIFQKATDFLFYHLSFISKENRDFAYKAYMSKSIGYSFAYIFKEWLAVSCLAYFIYSDQQNEQMKVLKEQQLMSEIKYLKAQLHPHFFFNTLNNIYSLALKQAKETAPLIAKLAEMMRYILYHTNDKLVPLQDEIAFIQNYVEVERIRYRSAINIDFDTQGITAESKISPLLLLPFIENAFKHGIEDELVNGFVKIIVCESENELSFEVTNSISGHKKAKGGIGLENLNKRLQILYPGKHKLEVSEHEDVYHPLAQDILEGYVNDHEKLFLVKKCSTAFEAFEVLHQQQIDVLFLDIRMPALNGIDFLKSLKNPPAVIFTTAFSEYAVNSYELDAVDYLLKPITIERFQKSLEKLFKLPQLEVKEQIKAYTYFKVSGQLLKVLHNDIFYVQSIKDYMMLYTRNGNLMVHMTMKYICDLLPQNQFIRVHRSYLINTNYIGRIGKSKIHINQVEIPIGTNYRKDISNLGV
eukprot:gene18711-22288_t